MTSINITLKDTVYDVLLSYSHLKLSSKKWAPTHAEGAGIHWYTTNLIQRHDSKINI